MHYLERAGGEPAVLCIHGYCQSSAYWAPTLERLARVGVRGLAPDLPGFGASARLPGPYTMEAYADAVAALLDAQRLARVTLVGGSMGGVVAQHFAIRHPARLTRLLLVATGGVMGNPAAGPARSNAGSRTLERLGEIRVPTLIIQGRHDRARTPEHGAAMRDRIQGARLEVLEGSGHTPQLEEPDAFHALAVPFLRGAP